MRTRRRCVRSSRSRCCGARCCARALRMRRPAAPSRRVASRDEGSSRWCRRSPTISTRSAPARSSSPFPPSPTRRKRSGLAARRRLDQRRCRGDPRPASERGHRHSGAGALDRTAAARAGSRRAAIRRLVRRAYSRTCDAIGALTGHRREAAATIARLRRETAQLHARTRAFARNPSVFVVLGSGPIWTAGSNSYIATLIALAGGANAASDLHAAYGQYSAEALLRHQPDVLVADAATHLDAALDREPWRSLRAVRLASRLLASIPTSSNVPGPSTTKDCGGSSTV